MDRKAEQWNCQIQFTVPRFVFTTSDDDLKSSDHRYIDALQFTLYNVDEVFDGCVVFLSTDMMIMIPHAIGRGFMVPWPDFPLSSKPFRYAVFALSSHSRRSAHTQNCVNNLAKFYKYINEAIEASSLMEVFMSSYAALLYSYQYEQRFESAFTFFEGICLAYSQLAQQSSNSCNGRGNAITINLTLIGSLMTFLGSYLRRDFYTSEDFQPLWRVHTNLQLLLPWVSSIAHVCISRQVVDSFGGQVYEQLLALDYLFKFHLHQYLTVKERFNLARETEIQEVTASLRQVICQIIALVPRMESFQRVMHFAMNNFLPWPWVPHPRRRFPRMELDVRNREQNSILLFGLATVIEGMINQSDLGTHTNYNSNISPALLLCRLRVLLGEGGSSFAIQEPRLYFWAALRLTSHVDLAGNHTPQIRKPLMI